MPSKWIEWVRKWAAAHNTTYACALSQPECKNSYRAKYGVSKKVPVKKERETMGQEDRDVGEEIYILPKKKIISKKKKELDEQKRLIELSRMLGEDFNVNRFYPSKKMEAEPPKEPPKATMSASAPKKREREIKDFNVEVGDVLSFKNFRNPSQPYFVKVMEVRPKSYTVRNAHNYRYTYYNNEGLIENLGKIDFQLNPIKEPPTDKEIERSILDKIYSDAVNFIGRKQSEFSITDAALKKVLPIIQEIVSKRDLEGIVEKLTKFVMSPHTGVDEKKVFKKFWDSFRWHLELRERTKQFERLERKIKKLKKPEVLMLIDKIQSKMPPDLDKLKDTLSLIKETTHARYNVIQILYGLIVQDRENWIIKVVDKALSKRKKKIREGDEYFEDEDEDEDEDKESEEEDD